MRKIIFTLLIAFCSIPILTFSQINVGAFGGINLLKLSGDAPDDAKYKSYPGLNIGVYFDLKLNSVTSLNLGFAYSQQGTKAFYKVPKIEDLVDSLQLRMNYLSIPLSFKVNSTNEKFYAMGGLEAGLLINKKLSSNDIEQDIDFEISDFNMSVHFGFGYRIPLGSPVLFLEAKYNQGLINITDEPNAQNVIPRVKTNGFNILAGIEIPLRKNKSKN
jgi:hypothetical protein